MFTIVLSGVAQKSVCPGHKSFAENFRCHEIPGDFVDQYSSFPDMDSYTRDYIEWANQEYKDIAKYQVEDEV